jgi:hypothetical protein
MDDVREEIPCNNDDGIPDSCGDAFLSDIEIAEQAYHDLTNVFCRTVVSCLARLKR